MGLFYSQLLEDPSMYTELEGEIVFIDCEFGQIDVEIDNKIYTGYCDWISSATPKNRIPKIGWKAKIRIYKIGGGFYPDNRVLGWSRI